MKKDQASKEGKLNKKSIQVGLRGIVELNFFNSTISDFTTNDSLNKENISTMINLGFKWNVEENFFAVIVSMGHLYKSSDEEKEKPFTNISVSVEFYVMNLKEHIIEHGDNKFTMEDQLLELMVGIAISTTRGILFSKTQGTFSGNLIFPLVSPKDILKSAQVHSGVDS